MIKGRVRSKFIIGFLLIFIISSSILNLFIRKSIYRNRDRNIKNEKTILLNSSREFIKGVLENEVGDVSEKALIKSSYNIALKLSVLNNSYVAIHDKSGKLIEESNTNIARRAIEEDEDVKNALNNKAYYVLKNYDEKTINLFSYPLYINDNYIGIISFRQDYTTNYNEYNNLIKSISIIQMAAIIIAVLFSAVLIGRITKPLKMLTKKIDDMKNGNYNGEGGFYMKKIRRIIVLALLIISVCLCFCQVFNRIAANNIINKKDIIDSTDFNEVIDISKYCRDILSMVKIRGENAVVVTCIDRDDKITCRYVNFSTHEVKELLNSIDKGSPHYKIKSNKGCTVNRIVYEEKTKNNEFRICIGEIKKGNLIKTTDVVKLNYDDSRDLTWSAYWNDDATRLYLSMYNTSSENRTDYLVNIN